MRARNRYIIYAVGFVIGLLTVSLFFSEHIISVPGQQGEQTRSQNVLLGEVVNSKEPIPLSWALFYQVKPKDKDGIIKRVMIFEETRYDRFLRVVERVRQVDKDPNKLELVSRKIMAADQVWVQLKEVDGVVDFEYQLRQLGMVFIPQPDTLISRSVLVRLRSHGPDAVPNSIAEIKEINSGLVERVTPCFFLEQKGEH